MLRRARSYIRPVCRHIRLSKKAGVVLRIPDLPVLSPLLARPREWPPRSPSLPTNRDYNWKAYIRLQASARKCAVVVCVVK
jgi:hypothetical protein